MREIYVELTKEAHHFNPLIELSLMMCTYRKSRPNFAIFGLFVTTAKGYAIGRSQLTSIVKTLKCLAKPMQR